MSHGQQFYYFFAGKKKQVSYLIPLNSVWKEKAERAAVNVLSIPTTQAQPTNGTGTDNQVVPTNNGGLPRTTDNEESCEPPNKTRRIDKQNGSGDVAGAGAGISCSYWPDGPEACYLFKLVAGRSTAETPQEAEARQIRLLQSV